MRHKKDEEPDGRKRRRRKQLEPANWNDVNQAVIAGFVGLAQALDGAVRFGRSRDGEVYSIGFYVGDEHYTEWIRNDDQRDLAFATLFDELTEDYSDTLGISDNDVPT